MARKVLCRDCSHLTSQQKDPWRRWCPIRQRGMDPDRPRYCRSFKPLNAPWPMCPKCGRPIVNGLYCTNCGTFIKKVIQHDDH